MSKTFIFTAACEEAILVGFASQEEAERALLNSVPDPEHWIDCEVQEVTSPTIIFREVEG